MGLTAQIPGSGMSEVWDIQKALLPVPFRGGVRQDPHREPFTTPDFPLHQDKPQGDGNSAGGPGEIVRT